MPLEPPAFTGNEKEKETKVYHWYKAHWFDNSSLADPRMLRTDQLIPKVDYYIDKLTYTQPDSVIRSVDEILDRVKSSPEAFQFFLTSLLNKYAASKIVGQDAVYVHIALNYYAKGRAPWIETAQLNKIVANARKLEPLLIGKKAADLELTVIPKNGTTTRLYDIDARYIVVYFWDPECAHCKSEIGKLKPVFDKYNSKGVKFVTVVNSIDADGKLSSEALQILDQNDLGGLLNTFDYSRKSVKAYDTVVFPALFILDSKKNIYFKKISPDQVDQVLSGAGL